MPGVANELDAGLPPENVHEYAVMVPFVSLPAPEKKTDCPGLTVTLLAGRVIVAVGGVPADDESVTKLATDGIPVEFKMNSM